MTPEEDKAFRLCRDNLDAIELDEVRRDPGNPNRGRCFAASLALQAYLGGEACGYGLYMAHDAEDVPHYWVQNSQGEILDVTADQYDRLEFDAPHDQGQPASPEGPATSHLRLLQKMREAG